ncbi:hypothetical protein [Carboxylicivirga caseinilyticus]|uniref:hypothetical protein n=1 Tax=Carboxylicivirga caseinilyticus TaxID=3417572 RepID=UPI003D358FCA|nr:hypothetical protein [Marinilabiliaceae bacterium A049]
MKKWNKDNALNSLHEVVDQIPNVQSAGRGSQQHMRWLANTLRLLEEIFGANSRYYMTLSNFSWQQNGQMIIRSWDPEVAINHKHQQAYIEQMNQASGLILAAIDHLTNSEIDDVYDGINTPEETSELFKIINLGNNKLRKIIRDIPTKEKEIQDKYEDLLVANDIDYSKPDIMNLNIYPLYCSSTTGQLCYPYVYFSLFKNLINI